MLTYPIAIKGSDAQIENIEGAVALHDSLVYGDWYYGYIFARKAD